MKSIILWALAVFASLAALAQDDTTAIPKPNNKPKLNLSGFLDVYYTYDFNKPEGQERPSFLYNHNRHNEFNLNLALIKLNLQGRNYRANIGLMAGTYSQYNLAAEQAVMRHVFEANAGAALTKNGKLWLDAGIFASHIGFEGAISADNLNLTRSILAENSPYYLAGVKMTYYASDKLEVAALINNGWQRIKRVNGNSLPGFGTQVLYKPNGNATLNWSTFIGTDDPDSVRRMRYFNNFYGNFSLTEQLDLIAGFDIGAQQVTNGSSGYNVWYSPVVIVKYSFTNKWAVAARGEYYQDERGVIIATGTPDGFKTASTSLNVDYAMNEYVLFRVEGRWFNSQNEIFEKGDAMSRNNAFVIGSIAVRFQ